MALHLNLFHEIEKQKALDRRDPLKLSLYAIGLVAAALAGYYVIQLTSASSAKAELARLEMEYSKLKPKAEQATIRKEELSVAIKTSDTLVKRIEGRFYWANVLQGLAELTPPDVQLTKLNGDIANDAVRHGTITLEGVAAGEEPRKVAENLRRKLIDKFGSEYKRVGAIFTMLEDGKTTAVLGGTALPTSVFTIKVTLQVLEDDAPPPPPKGGKKTAALDNATL